MSKRILIIEDEKNIVDILRYNLNREGYETMEAYNGEEGLNLALENNPDLILLDVMLPKRNGFDVCSALRKENNTTPVILLTAREQESDKVFGLEVGADDYITKPFSMRELLARVKANIRRTVMVRQAMEQSAQGEVLTCGSLRIDIKGHTVYKGDAPVELTAREFDLLCFLARQAGEVFSREALMSKVWNYDYIGDVRTVDVTIRRLREKVEDNPAEPGLILTKRGAGYLMAKGQ